MERDIRELSQVADLLVFRNVLKLAAFRTGQILKVSEIDRDAKMNSVTASRYLDLLETSFVVRKLSPFLSNKATRLIKAHKMYILESQSTRIKVYYWHVQGWHEVYFVIQVGREIVAIEVKAATRWEQKDLLGLKTFLKYTSQCKTGILAYNGREIVKLQDRIWAVPNNK